MLHVVIMDNKDSYACTHDSCTQNDTMASKSVMAALSVSFAVPRFSCGRVEDDMKQSFVDFSSSCVETSPCSCC